VNGIVRTHEWDSDTGRHPQSWKLNIEFIGSCSLDDHHDLVKHVLSPLTKCELSLSVSPGWSEDVGWPGDSAR